MPESIGVYIYRKGTFTMGSLSFWVPSGSFFGRGWSSPSFVTTFLSTVSPAAPYLSDAYAVYYLLMIYIVLLLYIYFCFLFM